MTLDEQIRECVECGHGYRKLSARHEAAYHFYLKIGSTEEEARKAVQVILDAEVRVYQMIHGRVPRGACPECLPIVQARQDARYCPEGA